MGLLDDKVAIVTGAGRGIGRAEALLFAREGARVLVNDADVGRDGGQGEDVGAAARVVAEIRAAGGTALADTHDVSRRDGATAMVRTAVEELGGVDVLVNNAGILRDKTLLKLDDEMWDDVLRVHLTGTFLCTQEAARQMVSQGRGGRIVNTISQSGLLGNFGQANYAAAKAGVYGLTRTAAIELSRQGITVNALAPVAKTRMTGDLPMFQGVESLGPEHVAPAALFLASELVGDRTGLVLAASGAQMYVFKLVQSDGAFKEGGEPWTAQEIAEHWEAIGKL